MISVHRFCKALCRGRLHAVKAKCRLVEGGGRNPAKSNCWLLSILSGLALATTFRRSSDDRDLRVFDLLFPAEDQQCSRQIIVPGSLVFVDQNPQKTAAETKPRKGCREKSQ